MTCGKRKVRAGEMRFYSRSADLSTNKWKECKICYMYACLYENILLGMNNFKPTTKQKTRYTDSQWFIFQEPRVCS